MLVSCVALPVGALGPELTSNFDERTSLMSFKVFLWFFGFFQVLQVLALSVMTIVGSFSQSMLIDAFYASSSFLGENALQPCGFNESALNGTITSRPAIDEQLGYLVGAIIFAVVSIPMVVLFLWHVPEKDAPRRKRPFRRDGSVRYQELSLMQQLISMAKNRAFVCITLIYLCSWLAIQVGKLVFFFFFSFFLQFVQNNLLLYAKYVLKREEWFSYLLLVLLTVSCLCLPVWNFLCRKYGKRPMMLAGSLVSIVAFTTVFFMDYFPQLAKDIMFWVLIIVAGFALSSLFLIPNAMFPDVIESDELATGMRREGIFYAFFMLFQKFALAGCVAVSNFILESFGYVSPETAGCLDPVQNERVRLALSLMVGIFPAAIMALSLIALFFYPITKELHLETLRQLDEQKKKRDLITTDSEAIVGNREPEPEVDDLE